METLVSLEGYDPQLQDYLQRHYWASIVEVGTSPGERFSNSLTPAGSPDRTDCDDTT